IEHWEIAEVGEIARRYFAMNAFDGVVTIIGVLVGNYLARVRQPAIVISTGLSTCIAMGVSGLWGAYLTESAERKRGLNELQEHVLRDLSETKIGRASRTAVVIVALVDGLAPFLSALVVLVPFFFVAFLADIAVSYYLSLGMALAALFGLGAFLGSVSRENVGLSGLKMITAGIVSMLLSYLLEKV
ncbi:MAG: VIT1/CCC1 transporter family protein, partial [Candidatus Bathyarchaeia archaeon]